MDPHLFAADLAEKPGRLAALAAELREADPWAGLADEPTAWLFLGMGSSHYANQVAAARLRARGVPAVAELAGSDLLPVVAAGTTVVAVSASGGSAETLDAVRRLREAGGGARFVALTSRVSTGSTHEESSTHEQSLTHEQSSAHEEGSTHEESELGALCDATVDLAAGEERGGVACRSFQHTLALLLALEARLVGGPGGPDVASLLDRAAEASAHLLDTRGDWLPAVAAAALGPHGTHVVAPARRISSALQSALMLREGPRLPAVGCETADWSHVDVYLTQTTDYRLVLLAGSRWEPELLDWVARRGSTLVAVGADVAGAVTVRYPHDDVDDVRLLTETLVLELVAAEAWADAC
jgi:glucosamine 6-phosphate synthetase-like amidotransferase/phosphosugar isomerase protein